MNEPKVVRTNLDAQTALVFHAGHASARTEISRFAAGIVQEALRGAAASETTPPTPGPGSGASGVTSG